MILDPTLVFFSSIVLVLAVATGFYGYTNGRSWVGYFFLGLAFPLVGLLVAIIAGPNKASLQARQGVPTAGQRFCPYCAEAISTKAIACNHCGRDVHSLDSLLGAHMAKVAA